MELIFELGCEELPASFVEPALESMKSSFLRALETARLGIGNVDIQAAATPRRLTLLITGLPASQPDLEEERTGPPARVAFRDGQPTKAAEGFARGQGVDVDALYTVETDKGEYLAARVFEAGLATEALLPDILTHLLEELRFPKSMRWGHHSPLFARPLRWILAVADGKPVTLSFAGVESSNLTSGHRFVAPEPIEVTSIADYRQKLRAANVMLDHEERKTLITELIHQEAEAAGGQIVIDPELVTEVAHLVEWPYAVSLPIADKYLELPREVLISSMRSHQRYFAVEEKGGGSLVGSCVVIYNTPVRDPRLVAAGNLRVLKARLDDARFFYDKDLQKSLTEHAQALDRVIWIGPLGTMGERSERMSILASNIAAMLGLDANSIDQAHTAARLAKADLVTNMVDEFPDLQGIIGGEYARNEGLNKEIATAIAEQYLPTSPDAPLPSTLISSAVALAEKLDAIVGCFSAEMTPSSTSDPYGLRRAALGVVRILTSLDAPLSLPALIDAASAPYKATDPDADKKILDFLVTRLQYLLAADAPTDVVNAVLATEVTEIPSIKGRVDALKTLRDQPDFEPLAMGFKRVVNILKKQAEDIDLDTLTVDPALFQDPEEKALFDAHSEAAARVEAALHDQKWSTACGALIALKTPVDAFFDTVMVMADDEALRNNRIALLASLKELFFRVADLSQISH